MRGSGWSKAGMGRRGFLMSSGAMMLVGACDMPAIGAAGTGARVDPARPVQVALLVPGGTGDEGRETLARNLENAARLAMADMQGVQIDLRVLQTGGDAGRAAQLAAQAVDDGAGIILGPLFSESATAVGNAVAGAGVNVLSFSNNPAAAGRNVFLLGSTFENTATQLFAYAAEQGKGRVMLITEQNEAGRVAESAARAAAARTSAELVTVQSYAFSQQGVVDALPRISQAARASGAQSVFLTAGSEGALPLLADLLPQNGISTRDFQYLGLTRWDIPPETMRMRGLQGGWFAVPDAALAARFDTRYAAAYGEAPHPVAGLAYDGMAAIGTLLRQGGSDALSAARLTQGSGFIGVNGVFRLRTNGLNERALAIAEIRDNSRVILRPAPRSFVGAGS
ncbi:MAG: penicillin-binding protein activator [Rhodobacteraceae bacterium]|nr:penicillin-binding protein activator [Paracoccaceae bacterium]